LSESMKNTRIAFFGSPRLASACLEELHRHFPVRLVVTQPDRAKGRGKRVSVTQVKATALERHIPVYKDEDVGDTLLEALRSHGIELIVVVAFGRILPVSIITAPVYGSLNLHASLLPKYRGASPIEAALLAGETETGLTLQVMAPEMDRGDILASEWMRIEEHWTAEHLYEAMVSRAPGFLARSVREYMSGTLKPEPQNDDQATYCTVIRKEHGRIDWGETAEVIRNRIRAYSLWPVAFTWLDSKLLRVFNARPAACPGGGSKGPGEILRADRAQGIIVQTGEGVLGITDLQIENRRRMDFQLFINGYRELEGKVLGTA